ncbi:hypothetical protein BJX63DRAFT_155903 [Aspergillus granulosus]|uniref:Uncharacterized protein n=1 Tax=Aspergillus granulosus TaxID=176169 RepID=A0ABR4HJN4_9EURO
MDGSVAGLQRREDDSHRATTGPTRSPSCRLSVDSAGDLASILLAQYWWIRKDYTTANNAFFGPIDCFFFLQFFGHILGHMVSFLFSLLPRLFFILLLPLLNLRSDASTLPFLFLGIPPPL